jgi:anti-sigma B factor antagonist
VILDLGGLSFLDSSGLCALVILNRRAQAGGWSLTPANPQPQVVRLLRLTRVDELLTVVERSPLS